MANQQSISLAEAIKRFEEAIRAVKRYLYSSEKEPKALLKPMLDALNEVYTIAPFMKQYKEIKITVKNLMQAYFEKFGKEAKSNTSVCTVVVTMPKDQIRAHYELSGYEYTILDKYYNGETLTPQEAKDLAAIREKMVHVEWTEKEMEEIRIYFAAMTKAYCIAAGIKESDLLWSVAHVASESWPHLHLGFFPASYVQDRSAIEDYENAKAERNRRIEEAVALGVSRKDAAKLYPPIKQPKALYGDLDREIGTDEVPIGCSSKRFAKGYLHRLNRVLERRMAEQGIKTKLGNGKGGRFDVQRTNKAERFAGSTEEKGYLALLAENERLQEEVAEKELSKDALCALVKKLEEAKKELEEQLANSEIDKEVATEELLKARVEVNEAEEKLGELQEEVETLKEVERERRIEIANLKRTISYLRTELSNLKKTVQEYISSIFEEFFEKWKKAKSKASMQLFENEAVEAVNTGITMLTEPINQLLEQTEKDLSHKVDGATFVRTAQKEGFARKRILEAAERKGCREALIANFGAMEKALEYWFDGERQLEVTDSMSDEEAALYMKPAMRADRALEGVLELLSKADIEIEQIER